MHADSYSSCSISFIGPRISHIDGPDISWQAEIPVTPLCADMKESRAPLRIAVLCKRRYTGKDVVADRFGRLYEIPYQLALVGHEVRGYCLDYHQPGNGAWRHDALPGALSWESRSLGYLRVPALAGYPLQMLRRLRGFSPDLLIGASDIPHVALTAWLARRLGISYALDLYDNFESFSLARVPGFVSAYRRAIRGAGLVTVVSEPLRCRVETTYGARCPVLVVANAVDRNVFKRTDRNQARRQLCLPAEAKLVGTAGGLHRQKGLAVLYAAWVRLAAERPHGAPGYIISVNCRRLAWPHCSAHWTSEW
jgi:teichuronic acid biosynthesis glycosyltransferase TuaC